MSRLSNALFWFLLSVLVLVVPASVAVAGDEDENGGDLEAIATMPVVPETYDRVLELTETAGTGPYALLGHPGPEWRNFRAAIADGGAVYYAVQQVGNGYEVGIGTLSYGTGPSGADVLNRTSITISSNGNAAVNWGGGKKTIFASWPADRLRLQAVQLQLSTEPTYASGIAEEVVWTTEIYDTANTWTSGSRITVPSFAKRARVTFTARGLGNGYFKLVNIDHAIDAGSGFRQKFTADFPLFDDEANASVCSGWLVVEPGDRLAIEALGIDSVMSEVVAALTIEWGN
jgi:hypothetical protein